MTGWLSGARRARAITLMAAVIGLLGASATATGAAVGAPVAGGTVTLLTDPQQSEALFLGGAAPFFTPPATLRLTSDAWRFTFPIAGGGLDATSGAGGVGARGGCEFWGRETMSAWLEVSFTKLRVATGAHATLSGVYWLDGKRYTLATLDMSGATVTSSTSGGHQWVKITHLAAHMSPWLKGRLTMAFPRYKPSGGRLGTVTVSARLR